MSMCLEIKIIFIILSFVAIFALDSLVRPQQNIHNQRALKLYRYRKRFREEQRLSDEWIKNDAKSRNSSNEYWYKCPCDSIELCDPIETTVSTAAATTSNRSIPVRQSGEVYGFASSRNGEYYNWTYISTVAWASSDELMCNAHQHGARAILASPSFNLTKIAEDIQKNKTSIYVDEWIQNSLALVQKRYRDGIVFDYEEPISRGSVLGYAYAVLIQKTRDVFHSVSPPLQVSTCVAWSANDIDGRSYPYHLIADASDLIYVMDYDTQSQYNNTECVAKANAPTCTTTIGIQSYLDLNISPKKLILGFPWYGYQYPCLSSRTKPDSRYCYIKHVSFRGSICSDAAGSEIAFNKLMNIYYKMQKNHTELNMTGGGMKFDESVYAPFFNHIVNDDNHDNIVYQYWFDNAKSLEWKVKLSKTMGLGGIGPFQFDDIDPISIATSSNSSYHTTSKKLIDDSVEMWSIFDAFFEHNDLVARPYRIGTVA